MRRGPASVRRLVGFGRPAAPRRALGARPPATVRCRHVLGAIVLLGAGAAQPGAAVQAQPAAQPGAAVQARPAAQPTYWVYVGSESSDLLHRIRFGPGGAELEASLPMAALYGQSGVPDRFTESEAPHGVVVDARRDVVFMTTGHGVPDGKLWKVEAGTGRLLAEPLDLGRFPASLGLSPDGRYAYVANFNLHGTMAPSSISVVHAEQMVEVARIETCTMPHGSRAHPAGALHYSVCMMDDQLVEIDAVELEVSRRLFLGTGEERALDPGDRGFHAPPARAADHADHRRADHADHRRADHHDPDRADHHDPDRADAPPHGHYEATCSPTWVQPDPSGERIYVACNRSDQVLEVDSEAWEVSRRFDVGRGPYNVDVTPDGRLLVVTLKQGDGVEVIDLNSGEPAARLPTSTRVVHGVAISPDSRFAFVSVEGIGAEPGRVDIIDLADLALTESVPVGLQASGIAFWKMEGG